MKALSIRQPWAWLIVNGHKPVENRTWETLQRGPLLIHAGQQMTKGDYEACKLFMRSDARMHQVLDVLPAYADLERGGIVGRAELVACTRAHESPFFTGPFAFVLANTAPLNFHPMKGALGLFNAPGRLYV